MAKKKAAISNKSLTTIGSGTSSSIKNLTWWDKQIKSETYIMGKPKDLTYREIVTKQRLQRKTFRTLSGNYAGLLSKASSSKSFQQIKPFAPKLKEFIGSTKKAACVWRTTPKVFKRNPIDDYEKCQIQMKSDLIDTYYQKIKSENDKIEDAFNSIISTDVDPLKIADTVKVSCTLLKEVPDITNKKLSRPHMARGQVITRLIDADIKALAEQKQAAAFGASSGKLKSKTNKYDFKSKYVNFTHSHPELESFQSVFEGISELETTKRFRGWLRRNPHIQPPAYFSKKDKGKGEMSDVMRLRSKTCHELLMADIQGYSEFNEAQEFYDALIRHRNKFSSSDSGSSRSSLSSASFHSFDISDINIMI